MPGSPERAILARFRDPEARARIRREVEAQVRVDPGSWERVVVSRVKMEKNRPVVVGRSLVEIANGWGLDPVGAYLRLLDPLSALHDRDIAPRPWPMP